MITDTRNDATGEEQAAMVRGVVERQQKISAGIAQELEIAAKFANACPHCVHGVDSYTTGTEQVITVRFDRSSYWEWRNASTPAT